MGRVEAAQCGQGVKASSSQVDLFRLSPRAGEQGCTVERRFRFSVQWTSSGQTAYLCLGPSRDLQLSLWEGTTGGHYRWWSQIAVPDLVCDLVVTQGP